MCVLVNFKKKKKDIYIKTVCTLVYLITGNRLACICDYKINLEISWKKLSFVGENPSSYPLHVNINYKYDLKYNHIMPFEIPF